MEIKEYGFSSKCLGCEAKVMVFAAQNTEIAGPILWTVGPGDHKRWMEQSNICQLAEEAGISLVSVDTSGTWGGLNRPEDNYYFEDFLIKELPKLIAPILPVSDEPALNYITGFSKGSYIAFRMALNHPERFGYVASIGGGGLDAYNFYYDIGGMNPGLLERMFQISDPFEFEKSDYNPENLVERIYKEGKPFPIIHLFCGEKDALARVVNVRMHSIMERFKIPHDFTLIDSGHDWITVNKSIEQAIKEMKNLSDLKN